MSGKAMVKPVRFALGAVAAATLSACAADQMAVNALSDALSSDAGDVFASDPDPEFVRDALPFGLKTYESLLERTPDHKGLLETAAAGFAAYAYLLQNDADFMAASDYQEAERLRRRASALFLRGRDFALRGLDLAAPGIASDLRRGDTARLDDIGVADIDMLYWAAAAWGGAINLDRNNQALIADLPTPGAIMDRVIALDPGYEEGAAQEFLIAYEMVRAGGSAANARAYYDAALEYSGGKRASVHLAYAESVAQPAQDVAAFRDMLRAAMAVDPEAWPEYRLINVLAQRRADWLARRIPELFLDAS